MMTCKNFVAIARAIAEVRSMDGADKHTCELISRALADVLKQDNAKFDRARFVAACAAVASELKI